MPKYDEYTEAERIFDEFKYKCLDEKKKEYKKLAKKLLKERSVLRRFNDVLIKYEIVENFYVLGISMDEGKTFSLYSKRALFKNNRQAVKFLPWEFAWVDASLLKATIN